MTAPHIAGQRTPPGQRRCQATIGVALLDQVPLFREGLSTLVNRTPGLHWSGAARDHRAAVQLHERHHPDVLLIDSALDPLGHFTRVLTEHDERMVVLTVLRDAHCTAEFAQRAFRRGARGVVPRNAEPPQIVQAIHHTPISRRYIDPTLAPVLAAADPDGQPTSGVLTRREFEVLQLIADGLENRAIAAALFVSVETVRTHIKGMLRKLGARDRAHAVAISYRIGLLVAATDR
ncbi:response regulator transcription factor [Kutzneria buriramensis]|uniref:DNA-binding NarL/FixJ family response regulator n=1 Tax=Kutzneria buriramensis TaxID=1045776 RepID=A0A3E0I8B8_9PSEU|nr:response regulator transcription factor [Kutzneria buriramensis]REH54994.1 DNA-binding NarL/FixJ family response regulator [Kutzneria buriramensis]